MLVRPRGPQPPERPRHDLLDGCRCQRARNAQAQIAAFDLDFGEFGFAENIGEFPHQFRIKSGCGFRTGFGRRGHACFVPRLGFGGRVLDQTGGNLHRLDITGRTAPCDCSGCDKSHVGMMPEWLPRGGIADMHFYDRYGNRL